MFYYSYFSSFGPCTIVDWLCCVEDDFGVLVVVPGPPRCRVLCSAGATWSDVNTPPNVDINSWVCCRSGRHVDGIFDGNAKQLLEDFVSDLDESCDGRDATLFIRSRGFSNWRSILVGCFHCRRCLRRRRLPFRLRRLRGMWFTCVGWNHQPPAEHHYKDITCRQQPRSKRWQHCPRDQEL